MLGRGYYATLLATMLAATVGCRTVPLPSLPQASKHSEPISQLAPPADGKSESTDKDLPPAEAARLCIAAAEECHKHGDELYALLEYEKARKFDPSCKVSRQVAVIYDRLGDFVKAQEEYRIALQQSPHDADLLNDMGYGYYARGRFAEAEKYLRQALSSKPKHARATMNLGLCLGAQEKYQETLELFEKVVTPAQAQCNLAFILTTHHHWPEARRAYEQALQLDPDIPLARAALAKLDKAEHQPAKETRTAQAPPKLEGSGKVGYVQFDDSDDKPVVRQAAHWTPASPPVAAAGGTSVSPVGGTAHP